MNEEIEKKKSYKDIIKNAEKEDRLKRQQDYYKNLKNCAICLYKMGKRTTKKIKCNHEFHWRCIDRWAENNNSCPLCREPIYQVNPEYFFFSPTNNRNHRRLGFILTILLIIELILIIIFNNEMKNINKICNIYYN